MDHLTPAIVSGPFVVAGHVAAQRPFGLHGILKSLRWHADAILDASMHPVTVQLAKTLTAGKERKVDAILVHVAALWPTPAIDGPEERDPPPRPAKLALPDEAPDYTECVQLALAIALAAGVKAHVAAVAVAREDAKPGAQPAELTTLCAIFQEDGRWVMHYPGFTGPPPEIVSAASLCLGIYTPAALREAEEGIL